MSHVRQCARATLAVLAAAAIGGGGTAAASPYAFGTAVKVSQPSTLTACPFGASADFTSAYDDAEVEPFVAVNPTNPSEIAGVFQQDRWPDGGARGLTSSLSTDGGASWALSSAPFSACQGGPLRFGRVTDPWASYDAAGNLYFLGQPIDSAALGISSVGVTTWNRTTSSWNPVTTLIEDVGSRGVFNDKISITGDWTRPGHAYATWIRTDFPPGQQQSPIADSNSFAWRGQPMISRTTDSGAHWSAPVPMRESNIYAQGNQIAVLPDGSLVDVAGILFTGAGFQPNPNGVYMSVMRSRDGGLHWTGPTKIGLLSFTQLYDPDDPAPHEPENLVRAEDYLPDIAVDHETGDLYVAWADGRGTDGNAQVVLSKSRDGGQHWTAPQVVATAGPNVQSFNHAVEVTADGTLVLTYYDFRNNVPGDGVATTDVWVRHSHDGGATWEPEQHLHGPFDMTDAPVSDQRGYFLGDYEGLAATTGDDAITFFTSALDDGADVWSRTAAHP